MNSSENTTNIFEQYRVLLFSIAYRMLSSATDAEDIVQEAFVRWIQEDATRIQSPKAYLSTIVVRLCIDQMRSARSQHEVYVGPWLPEPIATGPRPELVETTMLAESLPFAFLVLLEKLSPLERAVFLLREVFEYEYEEIVSIVGKSEANCRQIFHRAQQHLGEQHPRFVTTPEQQERITSQFIQASNSGDMQGLLKLLSDDIVFTGDSGGKVRIGHRVRGRNKVARGSVAGLRAFPPTMQVRAELVNGQRALVGYVDDQPCGVVFLDIEGEYIRSIYVVANPDKLHWLPSTSR